MDEIEKLKQALHKECSPPTECKMKQEMGLPEQLISAQAVFSRQFRWVASSSEHDVQYYFQQLTPNYANKTIEAFILEDPLINEGEAIRGGGIVHGWLEKLIRNNLYSDHSEFLNVEFFDGCGKSLYSLRFEGILLEQHAMPLNYANSDVVTHKLTLTYQKMERINKEPR